MEHDDDNKITAHVVGAIIAITCVVLIIMALESGRKSDLILSQLMEMRTTMGDAGYLPAEPRIEAQK